MMGFDQISGMAAIIGGIVAMLYANGTLPRVEHDPELWNQWRNGIGRRLRILGPLLVAYGFFQILRLLV